jgi:hypothetical protein
MQYRYFPSLHHTHSPQPVPLGYRMTRVPAAHSPPGSRSTTAAISWPRITSGPARTPVLYSERSDPQMPQYLTFSRTSPGPGSGIAASRTLISWSPSKNAARIVPVMSCGIYSRLA